MMRLCCPGFLKYMCEGTLYPGGLCTKDAFLGDANGVVQYCPYCGKAVRFEFESRMNGMNRFPIDEEYGDDEQEAHRGKVRVQPG